MKTQVSLLAATLMSIALLSPFAAQAADGTITITGAVRVPACTVDGSSGSSFNNLTLGNAMESGFRAIGDTVHGGTISITLNNCSTATMTQAYAQFSGVQGDAVDAAGYLMNKHNGSDKAVGYGLALYNSTGTTLIKAIEGDVTNEIATNGLGVDMVDGATNTLTYQVKYVATADIRSAGKIIGVVDVNMDYQ